MHRRFTVSIGILLVCFLLVCFVAFNHGNHLRLDKLVFVGSRRNRMSSSIGVHGPMSDIILYNRIPKTGSTSFVMGAAYGLFDKNHFNVIHINISTSQLRLSVVDQISLIRNMTSWQERRPVFYHGHMAFIDFTRFSMPNPIYIQIVRDPIERLVSYFYFLRFGDTFRPDKIRSRQGDTMTFDDCISIQHADCDLGKKMWVQIPFFCGQSVDCWRPGSKWALREAKNNLLHHYALVGITDDLQNFVRVLEAMFPLFFEGAFNAFSEGETHRRKTRHKSAPTEETIEAIKQSEIWVLENEFYQFAVREWQVVKDRTLSETDSGVQFRPSMVNYEKIRPKKADKWN